MLTWIWKASTRTPEMGVINWAVGARLQRRWHVNWTLTMSRHSLVREGEEYSGSWTKIWKSEREGELDGSSKLEHLVQKKKSGARREGGAPWGKGLPFSSWCLRWCLTQSCYSLITCWLLRAHILYLLTEVLTQLIWDRARLLVCLDNSQDGSKGPPGLGPLH